MDEVFAKVNGKRHYFWRAGDHEDEVREGGRYEASKYSRGFETPQEINKRYGFAEAIVTDRVASYRAVLRELGALEK